MSGNQQLFKGIFWITDTENLDNNTLILRIPVDSDGIIDSEFNANLNSKKGDNYNHKITWDELTYPLKKGKAFDYYPRGRVEISNGKARIYANPNICTDEIKEWLIKVFHVTAENGIKSVRMIPDYSEHYKCFLDR